MTQSYLKIAWRSIVKNRFYSLLHILGLGLGIACCLFIYLFADFHLSFDRYHKKAERIYRVVHELHLDATSYDKGASYAMYKALKNESTQVEDAAILISDQDFTIRIDNQLYQSNKKGAFTSSEWFHLFDYHWLQGSPNQLDEPNTVALTQSFAKKYFGDKDPMGKTLLIESKYPVKVIGIIDDTRTNTDLKSDIYLSISSLKIIQPDIWDGYFTNWGYLNSTNNVFISLESQKDPFAVERVMKRMAEDHMGADVSDYYTFKLLPLQDIHFDTRYGGTMQKSLLIILAIIGFGIMLVAAINYVNMVTAQQSRRSIEVGTRKVLGGSHLQLFTQFMTESVLISLIASLFALLLVWIVLPLANQSILMNEPIQIVSLSRFFLILMGIWLLVCLGSGLYPAYFLGRLKVYDALKNKVSFEKEIGRKSLVVVQNVVAQILIIASLIMVVQVQFLQNTDKGFDRESVIMVPLPKEATANKTSLQQYLNEDPLVKSYSFCYRSPAHERVWGGTILFDQRPDWETWAPLYAIGDSAYIKTFGISLVAGRNFKSEGNIQEYLINETMLSKLGFKSADDVLGKQLLAGGLNDESRGTIVGVVQDFNTKSLLHAIEPTVIGYNKARQELLAIKLSGGTTKEVISNLQREWQVLFPDKIFNYQFFDDQIASLYKKESLQQKLIWMGAGIAIVISSMGLLGLLSIMMLKRTKEIGIRKVLGASVTSIFRLLSSDFVKLVLIAVLIASPIAWWIMNKWLENFAYRIEIHWWMFALTGLLAIVIALLTVSFQAVKAATANPVDSLRDE